MMSSTFRLACVAVILLLTSEARTQDAKDDSLFERIDGLGYYHFVPTLHNWTEAYAYCQSLGSLLAVANSAAEAAALATLVQVNAPGHQYAFIGVSDINMRGEFLTVEGDAMSRSGYDQWTGRDPSLLLRCAGISRSGGYLTHEDCAVASPSICEIPVWKKEYTLVPGVGYYQMYFGLYAWPGAMMRCKQDGAHLAIINSDEEHRAILEVYNKQFPDIPNVGYDDFFWLGGHSQFNRFNYVTVFGVSLSDTGFNSWAAGEPAHNPGYLGLNRDGLMGSRHTATAYPEACPAMCEHELVA